MKGYLFDQFGDLSFYDIPALGISMIAAAPMVFILGFSRSKNDRAELVSQGMLLAALLALVGTLGRSSMPIAILLAGLMILSFPLLRKGERHADLFTLCAMVIGLGCGLRAVMVVGIAFPVLFLLSLRLK